MSTPKTSKTPAAAPHVGKPAGPAAKPLIREWHTMSGEQQTAEWAALVGWVVWIHDLYELSRTERLPLCWPQHPGLVEELRSLKAWREHIYDHPAAGTPHVARSWHGELRQTVAAAISFYAPGCRTGHTGAAQLATVQAELPATWIQHGPPLMDTAPQPPAAAENVLAAQAMTAALNAGDAHRHSPALPTVAHYRQSWWRRNDDSTWTRIYDPDQAADLDRSSQQMRAAAATAHPAREDDPSCQN